MVDFLSRIFKKSSAEVIKADDSSVREIVVKHDHNYGSSGVYNYGGYLHEDYLETLSYARKALVYEQMTRGDSNISMLMAAAKNPIKSAHWFVEPHDSEDAQSIKDAEFIEHILFKDMLSDFDQFLNEVLTFCEQGFSLFEITHKIVTNDKKFGSYVGIKNLYWRSQKTIERWNIDKNSEELISVSQYAYGDAGKVVDIPSEFLLLFNLGQYGANFEGISMIRPCYGNWFRKNIYLKMNCAGIEKYAIPPVIAEFPNGRENSEEYRMLVQILEAYTSHQSNYIAKPKGWDIKIADTSSFDPSKVEASIDSEDRRMSKAFLAHFLELIGGGSYALSQDLSDFFLSGLTHIAKRVTNKINHALIPHLIKINFGERDGYPQLKFSDINDKAGKEFAEVMSQLSGQKIIIPDDKLEDYVRNKYSLPDRSLDGQRTQSQPQIQPLPSSGQDQAASFSRKLAERFERLRVKR